MGAPPAALVIGFNRPDKLKECLIAIVQSGITELYVSLDAPRRDFKLDKELCRICLEVVEEFRYSFSRLNIKVNEINLGCKFGPIAAIDWFFQHEEFGIIIEDDILVTSEFLDYVSSNRNLEFEGYWHLNGWSMFSEYYKFDESYSSCFPMVWGWATWRSCWQQLDLRIPAEFIEIFRGENLVPGSEKIAGFNDFWFEIFCNAEKSDAWDYYWVSTIWRNKGLILSPPFALTKNIGFDESATHTKKSNRILRGREKSSLARPKIINQIGVSPDLDLISAKLVYGIRVPERELLKSLFRLPLAACLRVLGLNTFITCKSMIFVVLVKLKYFFRFFVNREMKKLR